MSVEDRQAMIIDAVIPLILERGATLTSRQIAEEIGIAEGTIFRAFGDKETLIRSAVEKYFDPQPMRQQMAAIDRDLPLRDKMSTVIRILQTRFSGVFSMMAAAGLTERPRISGESPGSEYATIIAELLKPDLESLNIPPERVGPLLRLISFASALPPLNRSVSFTIDELTDFALYGIAGRRQPMHKDN